MMALLLHVAGEVHLCARRRAANVADLLVLIGAKSVFAKKNQAFVTKLTTPVHAAPIFRLLEE